MQTFFIKTVIAVLLFFSTLAQANHRQIEDALGNLIMVPERPSRIVALSEIDFDSALAVGAKPVATIRGRGQSDIPRYLKTLTNSVKLVGDIGRPDIEQIIFLQPDLIITTQQRPGIMKQLSLVAPTVVTSKRGESWKTSFNRIANVLNRTQQEQRYFQDYDELTSSLKKRIQAKYSTDQVSIIRWNPKGPAYMLSDSFGSLIIRDLGLTRPQSQRQPGAHHSKPLSLEALNRIDADWIFLGTLDASGEAVEAMSSAQNSAPFKQLKAVQKSQVIPVDGSLWTSVGGPLAAKKVLADIENAMLKQ